MNPFVKKLEELVEREAERLWLREFEHWVYNRPIKYSGLTYYTSKNKPIFIVEYRLPIYCYSWQYYNVWGYGETLDAAEQMALMGVYIKLRPMKRRWIA